MDPSSSTDSAAARIVTEVLASGPVPLWLQPEWADRFPWLAQGTTGRGADEAVFDLGVYGSVPTGVLMERWKALRQSLGMTTVVHSRQVHASEIAEWTAPLPEGFMHVSGYDGHVSTVAGLLLAVSIADCVPVFIVSESPRVVAMVHSGWRGVAGDITERSIERMARLGARAEQLVLHCGPSICGECYEVGPEVHRGVYPDRAEPAQPTPIDLRSAISGRVQRLGLRPENVTISGHCTLCGPGEFFSHRGGSPARQMGVLGLRS